MQHLQKPGEGGKVPNWQSRPCCPTHAPPGSTSQSSDSGTHSPSPKSSARSSPFMAQALLKFLRPFAGGVKNCENAHLVLFYPLRDQERRARNDQLAGARHTSITSRTRVAREHIHRIPHVVRNLRGSGSAAGA